LNPIFFKCLNLVGLSFILLKMQHYNPFIPSTPIIPSSQCDDELNNLCIKKESLGEILQNHQSDLMNCNNLSEEEAIYLTLQISDIEHEISQIDAKIQLLININSVPKTPVKTDDTLSGLIAKLNDIDITRNSIIAQINQLVGSEKPFVRSRYTEPLPPVIYHAEKPPVRPRFIESEKPHVRPHKIESGSNLSPEALAAINRFNNDPRNQKKKSSFKYRNI